MHTVQHHRLQYSFLLVSHLTWMSPCDGVKLIDQASDKSEQQKENTKKCLNPVTCWISKAEAVK